MDALITRAQPLKGSVVLPADKAIAQRAVLLSALAEGDTQLAPWPAAEDCQRAVDVVRALGISVQRTAEDTLCLTGGGLKGLRRPSEALPCGESGTTLRLCAGVLAGQPFRSVLSAGMSLGGRPMRRIVEPLVLMGAQIDGATRQGSDDVYPPLTIHGRRPLCSITYRLPVASAQVKSALLLAGLFAEGRTTAVEPTPTRDHTERLLQALGAPLRRQDAAVSVEGGQRLRSPGLLRLPGDFSSGAFLLVAAACVPGSRVELREMGLNPTRTQVLGVLRRMGASVHATVQDDAWEPRGTVVVEAAGLRATRIEAREVPGLIDELPALMVAACCATGTTVLEGLGELRVKETDRIQSMVSGLTSLGAALEVATDHCLRITGGARLRGAPVQSAGDHRTAMALAVAGLVAEGTTTISGAECIGKSFGQFFQVLAALGGPASVKAC